MQLTKTIFQNSAIFIEKKWVENQLSLKSGFLLGKELIHVILLSTPVSESSAEGPYSKSLEVWDLTRVLPPSIPKPAFICRQARSQQHLLLPPPAFRDKLGLSL